MARTAGATTKASAPAAALAAATPSGGAGKGRANGETKVYHSDAKAKGTQAPAAHAASVEGPVSLAHLPYDGRLRRAG